MSAGGVVGRVCWGSARGGVGVWWWWCLCGQGLEARCFADDGGVGTRVWVCRCGLVERNGGVSRVSWVSGVCVWGILDAGRWTTEGRRAGRRRGRGGGRGRGGEEGDGVDDEEAINDDELQPGMAPSRCCCLPAADAGDATGDAPHSQEETPSTLPATRRYRRKSPGSFKAPPSCKCAARPPYPYTTTIQHIYTKQLLELPLLTQPPNSLSDSVFHDEARQVS